MSKKSVRFDKKDANDEFKDYGALLGDKTSKNKSSRFKEKHSLDSDEEDAEEETQLDEDEIEGNEFYFSNAFHQCCSICFWFQQSRVFNTSRKFCFVGQEDTEVDVEDGVRFTPFNMKEELEEGHFDSEGTYIFKKEKVVM
jgi:CD2 antigen cytoplasmic tail-binding protein 2